MCLAYPCHNLFLFRRMRPAHEIQPIIELWFDFCILQHSVLQAQQDLFATAARADSFFAPGLWWGRCRRGLLRAAGAGSCAPADPRRRRGRQCGGLWRGGRLVGGVHRRGYPCDSLGQLLCMLAVKGTKLSDNLGLKYFNA